MKKLFEAIGIVICVVLVCLIASCGTLGNGQIDAPVDVELVYKSPKTGAEYTVTKGPQGLHVAIALDGTQFVEAEDGSLVLQDPDGNYIKFTPAE